MSIEEDSYYPEMTITVDEETNTRLNKRLKERVPGGSLRYYIEELVKHAAAGGTDRINELIFKTLQAKRDAESHKAERIKALEDELRRLKGYR